MIGRLVTILAAALLSVIAVGGLAFGGIPDDGPDAVLVYAYVAPNYLAGISGTTSERDPPTDGPAHTTYDAVDLRSHGTLAHPRPIYMHKIRY